MSQPTLKDLQDLILRNELILPPEWEWLPMPELRELFLPTKLSSRVNAIADAVEDVYGPPSSLEDVKGASVFLENFEKAVRDEIARVGRDLTRAELIAVDRFGQTAGDFRFRLAAWGEAYKFKRPSRYLN